ncbi:dynactin subunit 3 [Terrapene carolina triunguis]|uniref:dynactin subunit 3 n=1 Tax=Terrapene triunguis TaxID=2587831 RepID=UPI000E77EDDF|nr:dynactin subunit 3 [Terrapene carolina triunguis]
MGLQSAQMEGYFTAPAEIVTGSISRSSHFSSLPPCHLLLILVEDLIKYLDPQYIDRMAVPDAMKLQFILAEEQFILSQVALLEQVNNLQPFLDSAHIKAAPDHAAKLQRLAQIHIQQQDQCEAVTENVRVLLEDYNKMTLLLSKQFVQWDEMLTQLEAAKQVKPTAE